MSNPATGANPTPASSGTGTTVPSGAGPTTATPVTGGSSGGTSVPDFVVYEKSFTSDPNWPADLVLNHVKSNWYEWDRRIHFIADQRGFGAYLRGTFPKPDATLHPRASLSWDVNNLALRGFIIEHISDSDYDSVSALDNAHDVYESLRSKHQNQGLYAQIKVINEALGTHFTPGTPLSQTIDQMKRLHSRFVKMGRIDDDKLLMILLFNGLGAHYNRLQTSINDMFTNGSTTSADVCNRLLLEEQVINDNASISTSTALAATTKPPRPVCANCKRPSHRTEFCIGPGGQMAGKTIEEARAAQDAARNAQKPGGSGRRGNRAATPAPTQHDANAKTLTVNGQCYMLVSPPVNANPATPPVDPSAAFAALSMPSYDEEEYMAVLATTDDAKASVDWNMHTRPGADMEFITSAAYSAGRSPVARLDELPFILDSGATNHISPEISDFKVLHSIPHHPVKGLSGSAIYAVGVGDIDLCIATGHVLKLTNVLYIPKSSVRLVSVRALNKSGDYITHFDSDICWVTNRSNATLVRGVLSEAKKLYTLSVISPSVRHIKSPNTATALYSRVPNIETWHRRLGHCNTRAIIEMAKKGMSQGMPIDLSSLPANCEHCALGKQSRTSVPKSREGPKATVRLEKVYVDLCGPMAVMSRAGNLYSMNVIDDFSGYVWTIPLRSKSDASSAFQIWHKAATVQTGDKLRVLVTDNGELVSKSMETFCASEGIDHQRTAPYTSAQNGRAERLHRTILAKARTMRIACNAPGFLWDEFCSTAAYLTTLTAATANLGHTPYELWFGRKPSLSHLREIGCHAFALQMPLPSKIYSRSNPFVLIGYAPHAKAYRLWDPASHRVFNSSHVTFTEHLEAHPSPLHPGTVLGTNNASSPPSWEVPGPSPNSAPIASPFSRLPDDPPPTFQYDDPPSTPPLHTTNNTQPSERNTTPTQSETSRNNASETESQNRTTTNTVDPSNVNDDTSRNNIPPTNTVHPTNTAPPITITIPPRPPLRRSARIQALSERSDDHTHAFLAEYSTVRDTHDLIPTDISVEGPPPTIDTVLTALSNGSLEPSLADDDEPTWSQAMASSEREYWIAGGRDELKSLQDLKVFVLVPRSDLPSGHRPLRGKLVCKRKRDDSGRIVRYKVRYVAKGFAQRYGIDYDKTTAPTVRLESFRAILHLAASLNWDLRQFDIKTAFLHGVLPENETMYMEQPRGFEEPGKEEWVMRLMKSIYGMKQASRIWNQTFHNAVTEWGFKRLECDWCVYRRDTPTGTVIFAVHVDDIISTASTPEENDRFRDQLKSKWEITQLGEPKFALGIAISRDRNDRTITLSQSAKIDALVEEYGQSDARPVDTPMVAGLQLRRPDKAAPPSSDIVEWADRTPYRSLVGSLMYLSVATRPDISYAVGRLSSFLDCYRLEHWEAAVRVLRYLKGTRSFVLTLGGKNSLTLSGYSDSDYANCVDTSRSIGGYCFTLGSGMISWSSRKQATVADSSCYAEYIALHSAAHETVFLRQLLEGLRFLPSGPSRLYCDNDAASRLSEDHVWHSHTKHIRVKYHYTRELVLSGDVSVMRVGSKENTADILTKPLARVDFQRLRHYLGVREPTNPIP